MRRTAECGSLLIGLLLPEHRFGDPNLRFELSTINMCGDVIYQDRATIQQITQFRDELTGLLDAARAERAPEDRK